MEDFPIIRNYGEGIKTASIQEERISYRRKLELNAVSLEERAADIRKVIEYFDKNPELEQLLNAMRRLGV